MNYSSRINRRAFLKLCGAQLSAAALAALAAQANAAAAEWPEIRPEWLPQNTWSIISKIPQAWIDTKGLLCMGNPEKNKFSMAPLAPTEHNRENSRPWHKLRASREWGIVLHWYGDRDTFDKSIAGYLRGFDGLRLINGELVRTSAHFVVGDAQPETQAALIGNEIGYLQSQAPAEDGTPYMGAHLQSLDFSGFLQGQHYFVNALDVLYRREPLSHHMLRDLYRGPVIDPNRSTIGIEISGHHFDQLGYIPGEQKIANVLGLVRALMLRYHIPAKNLMGHHELQIGKPDPGKNFLALIRVLIGILALMDDDEEFKNLVFGSYWNPAENPDWAVRRYFKFVRDYLVLTSTPKRVYDWEGLSSYWLLTDVLPGASRNLTAVNQYIRPVQGTTSLLGNVFLSPESHEGIDLYACFGQHVPVNAPVNLIADGQCLYVGKSRDLHGGKRAIFRHRQPDGAEFLSIYGHVGEMPELKTGLIYPAGYRLGATDQPGYHHDPFLHFALGYGASWEVSLNSHPEIPLNAGYTWIQQHFIDPTTYDFERFQALESETHRSVLYD